jgi:hypothetical protein
MRKDLIGRITEEEIEDIVVNIKKEITDPIEWAYKHGIHKFKVDVQNEDGYPLKLVGTFSFRSGNFSFALLLRNRRIRGLDCGRKVHHNPECEKIKGVHKHKWTDAYQDKEAYIPSEVDCSSIVGALRAFIEECNIKLKATIRKPLIPDSLDKYW